MTFVVEPFVPPRNGVVDFEAAHPDRPVRVLSHDADELLFTIAGKHFELWVNYNCAPAIGAYCDECNARPTRTADPCDECAEVMHPHRSTVSEKGSRFLAILENHLVEKGKLDPLTAQVASLELQDWIIVTDCAAHEFKAKQRGWR